MDGEAARRSLFETIGIPDQPWRLWNDVFNLYRNNDWEEQRITAANMTHDEIVMARQFMADRNRRIVATAGKNNWREVVSGMVYFRVEILPEFALAGSVLPPSESARSIAQDLLGFELSIYFASTNQHGRSYANSPDIVKDCDHYWWRDKASENWNEEEVDLDEEYDLSD